MPALQGALQGSARGLRPALLALLALLGLCVRGVVGPMPGLDHANFAPATTRVLVVCLQSSGCSFFMAVVAQSKEIAAAIDVAVRCPGVPRSPDLALIRKTATQNYKTDIAVLKVVLWGVHDADPLQRLHGMKRNFAPHVTILFVRHPADNLASLNKHLVHRKNGHATPLPGYACLKGCPADKLRAMEQLFIARRTEFNLTVQFGQLFHDRPALVTALRALGLPVEHCNFCVPSPMQGLVHFSKNHLVLPGVRWAGGGVHDLGPAVADPTKTQRTQARMLEVRRLCPTLTSWFDEHESSTTQHGPSTGSERSAVENLHGPAFGEWCGEPRHCPALKPRTKGTGVPAKTTAQPASKRMKKQKTKRKPSPDKGQAPVPAPAPDKRSKWIDFKAEGLKSLLQIAFGG